MSDPVEAEQTPRAPGAFAEAALGAIALVLALLSFAFPVGWAAVAAGTLGLGLGAIGIRRLPGGRVPGSSWTLAGVAASGVGLLLGLIAATGLVGGGTSPTGPSLPADAVTAGTPSTGPSLPGGGGAAPGSTTPAVPDASAGRPQPTPGSTTANGQTAGGDDAVASGGAVGSALVAGTDPGWSHADHPVALGETVQLVTKKDQVAVDVTVTDVQRDASAVPATLLPSQGHRFVAVSYTVHALGPQTYEQPANASLCRLFSADGTAHRPSYFMAGNGPALDAYPLVAPGQAVTGWVLFEIPITSVPSSVSYSPTAEWRL